MNLRQHHRFLPSLAFLGLCCLFSVLLVAGCSLSPMPTPAPTAVPAAQQTAPGAYDPATRPPTPLVTPAGPSVTSTAGPTDTPTASPPTATPTLSPWLVVAGPSVPEDVVAAAQEVVERSAGRFAWRESGEGDVTLVLGDGQPLARWSYAVVAPFATVEDGVSLDELRASWQMGSGRTAIMTAQASALLEARWGPGAVQTVRAEDLVGALWQQRPAWGLVPFHRLRPELKVLRVDGASPLDQAFEPDAYPFTIEVGVTGEAEAVAAFVEAWSGPTSNRDPGKMTRVAMTGVTALVRATAYQMEIRSILYPGQEVAPVLQAADVAHVSNEVSFVPGCPSPHYVGDPVFCSDPRYLELLTHLGVDVVELTGNHLNDWGAHYTAGSLELYEEAGMHTFGGGRNLAEAREPAVFEHNGNRIAFVGCNPVGPAGAWATAERAGALPCDDGAFKEQIRELRDQGHLVIATQQYQELYHYAPSAQQRADFRALAEAGAAAVSGSQGHHAQGFDFHQGAFIHYGLGNLFFDQMDRLGTRQTLVDTYVIHDGRLIAVELWTGLIENYARPRQMTAGERAELLRTLFEASGW